jgi:hypothetical protein
LTAIAYPFEKSSKDKGETVKKNEYGGIAKAIDKPNVLGQNKVLPQINGKSRG